MYRILIVEDEEIVRNSLKNTMEWASFGFEAAAAVANGAEALRAYEELRPHVLLTDIRMPDMDGLQLMEILRRRSAEIEFVILSGFNDFEYARKGIQLGAFAYLTKPLNEKELEKTFTALEKKLEEREKTIIHMISEDASQSLESLQQAFLMRILSRNMGKGFIQLRARELKVRLVENFLCLAAVEIRAGDERHAAGRSLEELYAKSASYWSGRGIPVVLMNSWLVVIKNSPCKFSVYDFIKDLREYESCIRGETKEQDGLPVIFSAGISGVDTGFENIHRLYNEALAALHFKFYRGMGAMIPYSDIRQHMTASLENERVNRAMEKLLESVCRREQNNAVIGLSAFLEEIKSVSPADIDLVRLKCLEFFMSVFRKMHEKDIRLAAPEDKEILYKEIQRCPTLEALKDWFLKKISGMMEVMHLQEKEKCSELVRKINRFVLENLDRKLTLEDIAERVHMNPVYLSSAFKKETGENLNNYITEMRVGRAKEYLTESEMSVQEIADRLGFSDYRYFCTVFKKETGSTPLEFRAHFLAG